MKDNFLKELIKIEEIIYKQIISNKTINTNDKDLINHMSSTRKACLEYLKQPNNNNKDIIEKGKYLCVVISLYMNLFTSSNIESLFISNEIKN